MAFPPPSVSSRSNGTSISAPLPALPLLRLVRLLPRGKPADSCGAGPGDSCPRCHQPVPATSAGSERCCNSAASATRCLFMSRHVTGVPALLSCRFKGKRLTGWGSPCGIAALSLGRCLGGLGLTCTARLSKPNRPASPLQRGVGSRRQRPGIAARPQSGIAPTHPPACPWPCPRRG